MVVAVSQDNEENYHCKSSEAQRVMGTGQTYPELTQLKRSGVQTLESKMWKRAIEMLYKEGVELIISRTQIWNIQ